MTELYTYSNITFFILGAVISLSSVPLIIIFSNKFNFTSRNYLSKFSHGPIPLLGGLSLYFATLIGLLIYPNQSVKTLLICATPLVLIGAIDDLKAFSSKPKFVVQIIVALAWVLTRPDGALVLEQIGLPHFVAVMASVFWMVGLINAFNFIDGMDGLAAGTILCGALGLVFLNGQSEFTIMLSLLAGSALGFLFFNFHPAKIYLGDIGGTFSGFIFSSISVVFSLKQNVSFSFLIPLLLFCLPEIDAILAMARRARYKKSLFKGDLNHIHHKLSNLGLTNVQVALVFYAVNIFAAAGAFSTYNTQGIISNIIFLSTVVILSGILFLVYKLDRIRIKKLGQMEEIHERVYASTGTED
ncbi:MAG: undecaprenyl/decaprenyl-phosphate alpha-N-acetylglucosaminyl 1-phosphate transferase [Oligoflexia bacterium]|nr:undecaprenyl/decaprenyl-phosphate alpha-N-acetylglucosaminyl 1-phosphate transferase [Oligoflexia bacterium]